MFACSRPGQLACTFLCASRNSWSRPGFTRKRTALKAVMVHLSLWMDHPTPSSATVLDLQTIRRMLDCPQAHPLSSVDTGADALGSGFQLWKRRTDHVKRFAGREP